MRICTTNTSTRGSLRAIAVVGVVVVCIKLYAFPFHAKIVSVLDSPPQSHSSHEPLHPGCSRHRVGISTKKSTIGPALFFSSDHDILSLVALLVHSPEFSPSSSFAVVSIPVFVIIIIGCCTSICRCHVHDECR